MRSCNTIFHQINQTETAFSTIEYSQVYVFILKYKLKNTLYYAKDIYIYLFILINDLLIPFYTKAESNGTNSFQTKPKQKPKIEPYKK